MLAWGITGLGLAIFYCNPISDFWSPTASTQSCIDANKFYIGNAIPNILMDVAILIVPMRKVWGLHVSTSSKIGISGMFLLGSLSAFSTSTNA